jgi:hypothetical protein
MAKYVRTSKCLQRLRFWIRDHRTLKQREESLCCFLHAIQESTSLKELDMKWPPVGEASNLAFAKMLTHTQSLRSLSLVCTDGLLADTAVVAAASGLKNNTTLRELSLECSGYATTLFPLLIGLRDHPLLRRLCLCGDVADLTGLETLLLSENSKITELAVLVCPYYESHTPMTGLTRVLRALARRPTLTKLTICCCPLGRGEARLLRLALYNIPSLQSLDLIEGTLGSAELAEVAPALYHNTSIKELNLSSNNLNDFVSAALLRDILRHNKTMTALDLSRNYFGETAGAIECIADGLGSNSTLVKINLSLYGLVDDRILSMVAQKLGSLQKLYLGSNSITSTGLGVLLETMELSSYHIKDLDFQHNPIGNDGASLLARALGDNALPSLARLSLFYCGIGDDGFIALVSALEQNTSLLSLDLRNNSLGVSERAFLALAESLPEIKVLQRVDLSWCTGLASAMPLLLAGLRKNTSLFHFQVTDCTPFSVPPTPEEMVRCAGGWMQEMERVGYKNSFLSLIRAPKELPSRGIWPHAFARVATLHDVIFEVLRSKPSLVSSEETVGKEAAEDAGVPNKRKRDEE